MNETTKAAADGLARVEARLADESRWTTGARARDTDGVSVWPTSPRATQWCLEGACYADIADDTARGMVFAALDDHARGPAELWNDSHTHAEVLQLIGSTRRDLMGGSR